MSEQQLDKILTYVDNDGNGYITFQEFLISAINPKDQVTDSKLRRVFEAFDEDKSGAITVGELKTAVSAYSELDVNGKKEEISEQQWKAMLASYYSDDGDNEISYDEFKQIMAKLFNDLKYDDDDAV